MDDIKLMSVKRADYIPNDGILCGRCIHFEKCPLEYVCETLEKQFERIMSEEKE